MLVCYYIRVISEKVSNRTSLKLKPNTIAQNEKKNERTSAKFSNLPQAGTNSLEKYEVKTWQTELKAAINDNPTSSNKYATVHLNVCGSFDRGQFRKGELEKY